MKVDEALVHCNPLGKAQFIVACYACFSSFISSSLTISTVFLAETPEFHCAAPSPGIPMDYSVPKNDDGSYSHCEQYNFTSTWPADGPVGIEKCTNGWEYDYELFGESIVTEFDLVCDKGALPQLAQSIIIAGLGVGSLLAGPIADTWGRRPTFMTSLILYNMIGLAVSFSVNYAMFVTLRFLWAIAYVGFWSPTVVMLFEYLIPKYRSTVGNVPPLFFSLGLLVLGGTAYFVRDWRWFQASMMVPSLALIPFIWLFPESVRWQLSAHRFSDAEKTMQKVAKFNKAADVPTKFFEEYTSTAEKRADEEKATDEKSTRLDALDLFKPPILIITLVMGLQWFCFFLIYFGFALSTGKLSGDPYLNFIISGLFELPARMIAILLLRKSGSIIPISVCFAFSGLMMLGMIVIESGSVGVTICALLGRFSITFIYQPLMMLTSDLLPTTIRNAGTGVVHIIGRFGSFLAPLLLYLDSKFPGLAFTTMASVACFSAVVIFLLPETLNAVHPSTKEDVEAMMKTRRLITLSGCRKPTTVSGKDKSIRRAATIEDKSATIVNQAYGDPDSEQPGQDNPGFDPSRESV